MNADLNIYANGELSAPLKRFCQEVDIILMSSKESIITNYKPGEGPDKYLFKNGVSAFYVAKDIENLLQENLSRHDGIEYNVECQFLKGLASKDILYINIIVSDATGTKEQLQYTIK